MNFSRVQDKQAGFTLLELLISVLMFMVISGAIFELLSRSQKRYFTDSQVLDSFQEARLAMDQIVRDANDAGYPPQNHFSILPAANNYAQTPVAWNPGYTIAPPAACSVGVTCATPNGFDVIFEEDNGAGVQWIRYQLPAGTTTLMRGITPKVAGGDPVAATGAAGVMFPYVRNVMNNASAAQIAAIKASYPTMFPGGNPVPVFTYVVDAPIAGVAGCAGAVNSPCNIHDIQITLVVQTPQRDADNNLLRVVELSGRAHRVNPNR